MMQDYEQSVRSLAASMGREVREPKEIQILMKGMSVRGILDGVKTQTRRVCATQTVRIDDHGDIVHRPVERWERQVAAATCVDALPGHHFWRALYPEGISAGIDCPYGQPGDTLWVRETWRSSAGTEGRKPSDFAHQGWPIWYQADGAVRFTGAREGGPAFTTPQERWRASIHMPRWACRLLLNVERIRLERLQDITEEDAKAEGVTTDPIDGTVNGEPALLHPITHRQAYAWVWDKINGHRHGSLWKDNPWVWVIDFESSDA